LERFFIGVSSFLVEFRLALTSEPNFSPTVVCFSPWLLIPTYTERRKAHAKRLIGKKYFVQVNSGSTDKERAQRHPKLAEEEYFRSCLPFNVKEI